MICTSYKYFSRNLEAAIIFADEIHKNQTRKGSNLPYINHPIKVAEKIIYYIGENEELEKLLIAAILHDTLEDTNNYKRTSKFILECFGIEIMELVFELTSNKVVQKQMGKTEYLQEKMTDMSENALTIKLCDRLSNIEDLKSSNDNEFISRYTNETISILCHVLGSRELNNTQKQIIKDIFKRIQDIDKNNTFIIEDLFNIEKINRNKELEKEFIDFINNDKFKKCSYKKARNR